MTCPYLLDVNLLVALADPMHLHHNTAHQWFGRTGQAAWATCPLTENGFVRVASNPKYTNRPGNVPVLLAMLRDLCKAAGHIFWNDDISLREILDPTVVLTHNQITDVYLLGLAVHHDGKLATLDERIPVSAVRSGETAIEIVRP